MVIEVLAVNGFPTSVVEKLVPSVVIPALSGNPPWVADGGRAQVAWLLPLNTVALFDREFALT
jgi:hypothetical protein